MLRKTQTQARIDCTEAEWEARVELACAYRLFDHFGWHSLIYNHITLRIPGPERHFLINPFGLMYREVTASNLLKVDLDGNKLTPSPWEVWEAGFVVHSAVHRVREDIRCVMHTHTVAGVAVACQAQGLLPLDLTSLLFTGRIAYHELEGITTDRAECDRIAADLGDKSVMILRNHGLLTCGPTVADAFQDMYQLEQACRVQLAAQSSGVPLNFPAAEVARKTAVRSGGMSELNGLQWAAMRRWMEETDPSFMN
ncbi:MAG: class aldolase [Rhodospirillales bacterium]|nr:class aldolase [Rhodospirillales bacterium]